MARRRLAVVAALGLIVALGACCPVAAPPRTAFVARLEPRADGTALARLADGRQLTVTGLTSVPTGVVYVTGRLLPNGRVEVASVRPTVPAAGPVAGP
ncbi:MAG: hypothetical protein P8Y13_02080 [Deinococcales bacterium]